MNGRLRPQHFAIFIVCAMASGVAVLFMVPAQIDLARSATFIFFAAGLAVAGRRDLTRPPFLLPILWFVAAAIAPIPVLNYHRNWSSNSILLIYLVPLIFAASSAVSGGLRLNPASSRGSIGSLSVRRLRTFAFIMFGLGLIGITYKAALLGGVPILSDQIDQLRSAGGVTVPFYVTFATDGMTISAWLWGLAALAGPPAGRIRRTSMMLISLLLVSASGSRNVLLVALVVPVFFCFYIGILSRIRFRTKIAVGALIWLIVSGLFFFRIDQQESTKFGVYFASVVSDTPALARPLLPIYVGLSTPLDTLALVVDDSPSNVRTNGVQYSFPGLPDGLNPFGTRSDFYAYTGDLSSPYYFNVATFVGPVYADAGIFGSLLASLLLGLASGAVRRRLAGTSNWRLAVLSYLTYGMGFLLYENLISFYTLSVAWNVIVVGGILCWCERVDDQRSDTRAAKSSGRLVSPS